MFGLALPEAHKMAQAGSTFDWFLPIHSAEMPAIRLFCFPHAGGSASSFSHWAGKLSQRIDVVAIAPPGRGSRMQEPLPDDTLAMAATIADGLKSQSDVPFAFFGHSFGSLVAYECARELQRRGQAAPVLLIASAHEAPQLSGSEPTAWLHALPDVEFLKEARSCGFIPEEAVQNAELLAILAPVLRADLRLNETYKHEVPAQLLTCPVVAFGGTADFIEPAALQAWQAVSAETCPEARLFSGGHFYQDENEAALSAIGAQLISVVETLPPSVIEGGLEARYTTEPSTAKPCHELFDEQARRSPDVIAIVDVLRQLTYEQLRLESDLLARKIQQLGGGKGSIIGSYMPHRAEYIIANLAIFKAGGAIFPLETNYPPELLAELAEMAGIDIVLTIEEMKGMLPTELRTADHSICLEGEWYATLQGADLPELRDPGVCLADPAYVTMTSGSTGRPKGIINAHIGATCNFLARFDLVPYHEGEREALNVFFVWECLRPLLKGATAYIIPDDVIFDPKRLANFIHEHCITRLMTTTQLLEAILEYPGLNVASRLDSIRYWYLEGEPVPARVVNKWLAELGDGHGLYNVYSTWESLDCSYAHLNQEILTSKFAPIGLPIKNVTVYLMTGEDDSRQIAPLGSPGEIYVDSPGLALSYLGDPVKTAEKFLTVDVTVNGKAKTLRLCLLRHKNNVKLPIIILCHSQNQ